jgi:transcriptional regulator with XRE-family HTH domain
MTQEEFSCFLGIGYASVQKYESGVGKPGYKALRIICKRFPKYALALVIDFNIVTMFVKFWYSI